ncbi:MAG TPA: hypothetical protein PKC67_04200 [Kiritimatiellia bacterium]|nr:hypothetical protein [Kiritimatiellia bacterium]HMP33530.1 hypothetical protein [Kiritimatiellia bacterium]
MNRRLVPLIILLALVALTGMVGRIALPAWLVSQGSGPAGSAYVALSGISLAQGLTALVVLLGIAAWTVRLAIARGATPWRWCVFSLVAGPVAPALLMVGCHAKPPETASPAATGALDKTALLLSLIAAIGLLLGRPMALAMPEFNTILQPYGVNQISWLLLYVPAFAVHIGIGRWLKDLAIDDHRDHPTFWGLFGLCFGPLTAALYLLVAHVERTNART